MRFSLLALFTPLIFGIQWPNYDGTTTREFDRTPQEWGIEYNVGNCLEDSWTKTFDVNLRSLNNEGDILLGFGTQTQFFGLFMAYDGFLGIGGRDVPSQCDLCITPRKNGPLRTSNVLLLKDDSRTVDDPRDNFINGRSRNQWKTEVCCNTDMEKNIPLKLTVTGNRGTGTTIVTITKGSETTTFTYTTTWSSSFDLFIYIAVDTINNEKFRITGITENSGGNDVCTPANTAPQVCQGGFPGIPACVWGDPHYTQYNGFKHNFQGEPRFYYYMTPCNGSDNTDMRWNLIAKHYPRGPPSRPVTTIEYLVLELFDTNGDRYLVFFSENWGAQYTLATPTTSFDYFTIPSNSLIQIILGVSVSIGNVFTIEVKRSRPRAFYFVDLDVDDSVTGCSGIDLEFRFKGTRKFNNYWAVHNLCVDPPPCNRCDTCCLLGSFSVTGNQFELLDGSITTISRRPTFGEETLSCLVPDLPPNNGPPGSDDPPADDPFCDRPGGRQQVIDECARIEALNQECCELENAGGCGGVNEDCEEDVCAELAFIPGATFANVPPLVEEILGGHLTDLCENNDPNDEATGAPTETPTLSPVTPTQSPSFSGCPCFRDLDPSLQYCLSGCCNVGLLAKTVTDAGTIEYGLGETNHECFTKIDGIEQPGYESLTEAQYCACIDELTEIAGGVNCTISETVYDSSFYARITSLLTILDDQDISIFHVVIYFIFLSMMLCTVIYGIYACIHKISNYTFKNGNVYKQLSTNMITADDATDATATDVNNL